MSVRYEKSEGDKPLLTPDEYLEQQKRAIRRRSYRFLALGILITAILLIALFAGFVTMQDLFRSIFFILGLFGLAGGAWGIYYAKKLTLKDLIPSPEAIEFIRQGRLTKPYFSYVLVGSIIVVTLFQLSAGIDESAKFAGLVKPLVWKGDFWRLLTYAALHGFFPVHLYFNAQALYGFGTLIESIANRAHLATVFVSSVIGGGLLSLFFMPDVVSIGASGGIMGLIGYLAIYGYRRGRQLPPDFLKSMLINIGFIAAFGIVAYKIVDNFGHLGGLLTGVIYGFVQIPKDLQKNPRRTGTIAEICGFAALGIFVSACIFTVLLVLKIIRL